MPGKCQVLCVVTKPPRGNFDHLDYQGNRYCVTLAPKCSLRGLHSTVFMDILHLVCHREMACSVLSKLSSPWDATFKIADVSYRDTRDVRNMERGKEDLPRGLLV